MRLYIRPSTPVISSKAAAAASNAFLLEAADRVLISLTRSNTAASASGVFRSSSIAVQNFLRASSALTVRVSSVPNSLLLRAKSRFSRQVYRRSRLFLQLSMRSTV